MQAKRSKQKNKRRDTWRKIFRRGAVAERKKKLSLLFKGNVACLRLCFGCFCIDQNKPTQIRIIAVAFTMASSKIPHVTRELRRHIARSNPKVATSPSNSSTSTTSTELSFSRPKVVAGCVALAGFFFAVPYVFVNWIQPLSEREDSLTGSQIRRGAFNNSGSKDVGRDPYWDFKRGRRKKLGEDGCDDDGGYEDLFKRDDPSQVDHGDHFAAKTKKRM